MVNIQAKFSVGQLVHHKIFGYRGVIIDVDPYFRGTHEWYGQMARSKPPKDRPWYHVLVDGQVHRTYVAERNLEPDEEGHPISHPDLDSHFETLGNDGYVRRSKAN